MLNKSVTTTQLLFFLQFILLVLYFFTWRTIFLWMANFAMMWARSRWPLYLHAGSTQALGSRHGQAKVIRRRSLLLRDLLLSWMWWGACSTSSVENWSRQILSESSRSACFSGSNTLQRDGRHQMLYNNKKIKKTIKKTGGSFAMLTTSSNCIWSIVNQWKKTFFSLYMTHVESVRHKTKGWHYCHLACCLLARLVRLY